MAIACITVVEYAGLQPCLCCVSIFVKLLVYCQAAARYSYVCTQLCSCETCEVLVP